MKWLPDMDLNDDKQIQSLNEFSGNTNKTRSRFDEAPAPWELSRTKARQKLHYAGIAVLVEATLPVDGHTIFSTSLPVQGIIFCVKIQASEFPAGVGIGNDLMRTFKGVLFLACLAFSFLPANGFCALGQNVQKLAETLGAAIKTNEVFGGLTGNRYQTKSLEIFVVTSESVSNSVSVLELVFTRDGHTFSESESKEVIASLSGCDAFHDGGAGAPRNRYWRKAFQLPPDLQAERDKGLTTQPVQKVPVIYHLCLGGIKDEFTGSFAYVYDGLSSRMNGIPMLAICSGIGRLDLSNWKPETRYANELRPNKTNALPKPSEGERKVGDDVRKRYADALYKFERTRESSDLLYKLGKDMGR